MQVDLQVLATKEVPVEAAFAGAPEEGYLATGVVECEPSSVMLAGTASALAEISKISIPEKELDITGESGNVEKVVDIRKYLENASLADGSFNGRVTVTVHIEPVVERTLVLSQRNITLVNLPEGYEWGFTEENETYRVRISGLDEAMAAVNQNTVQGTIDIGAWMTAGNMQELTTGGYEIPVSIALPDGVSAENEISVRVNIVKLEDE